MSGQALSGEQLLARYERLIEISQQLTSTLDPAALLHHIIAAATELTNTETASILLIDPMTGELRFELSSNMSQSDTERLVVPMEGSIAGWVVRHGEARVIDDVSREPGFYRDVDEAVEFHTRSLLAVPMRVQNRVIGALEALNKRNSDGFQADDMRTLTILAGQAAIAIENARMFQQSDFMAEMVHELRTPLAALRTSIALLKRPEVDDDRRVEIIDMMSGETERLISLTTDYLDLARLESGRVRLHITEFPLLALIDECFAVVKSEAVERNVELSSDGFSLTVSADRRMIKQVLLNLLTNAIKFNRPGGRANTYVTLNPDDKQFALIEVADTGYGVTRENQTLLFQRFFRAPDTASFTHGTGLGLAIARHIVETHGGAIWMESEPGTGSRFYVTLPLAPQA